MTKKEELLAAFKAANGKELESLKGDAKEVARLLNNGPGSLRATFRDAVEEAKAKAAPDDVSVGLANLFAV